MTVFIDDFARADGAPGNGWVNTYSAAVIASGMLRAGGESGVYQSGVSDAGRISSEAYIIWAPLGTGVFGPGVKCRAGATDGYYAFVHLISGVPNLSITGLGGGAGGGLVSVPIGSAVPAYYKVYIEWDHGHLLARYNDSVTAEADQTALAANPYTGFYFQSSTASVDRIVIVGGTQPALAVNPTVIPNYGTCTEVALTGANTAWTPGTPGSPTFTVNHGTISAQTIADASHATLTYCPGSYLGAVVFTDPSSGQTAGALVTSDPGVVNPSGLALSETAIAYIERSAVAQASPTILNQDARNSVSGLSLDVLGTFGQLRLVLGSEEYTLSDSTSTSAILYILWDILTHRSPGGSDASFRDVLSQVLTNSGDARDRWQVGETTGLWRVDELLNILGGITHKSHEDILAAIAGVGGGDPQQILDAIAAARGEDSPSIRTAIDLLGELSTAAGYNLSDVAGWVSAVRGSGSPTIAGVLAKLGGSGNTIEARIDALSDLIVTETTISGLLDIALTAFGGEAGLTLASARDAILDAMPAGLAQASAPVLSEATSLELAAAIPFTQPFLHEGACHGLVYTISTHGQGVRAYNVGARTVMTGAGTVAFISAGGYPEPFQPINFDRGIILPKHMARASGFIFSSNVALSGSVNPFDLVPA